MRAVTSWSDAAGSSVCLQSITTLIDLLFNVKSVFTTEACFSLQSFWCYYKHLTARVHALKHKYIYKHLTARVHALKQKYIYKHLTARVHALKQKYIYKHLTSRVHALKQKYIYKHLTARVHALRHKYINTIQ